MTSRISGAAAPLAVRVYGAMLRLLPREFQRCYGAAAGDVFDDMYREARARGALGAVLKFTVTNYREAAYTVEMVESVKSDWLSSYWVGAHLTSYTVVSAVGVALAPRRGWAP